MTLLTNISLNSAQNVNSLYGNSKDNSPEQKNRNSPKRVAPFTPGALLGIYDDPNINKETLHFVPTIDLPVNIFQKPKSEINKELSIKSNDSGANKLAEAKREKQQSSSINDKSISWLTKEDEPTLDTTASTEEVEQLPLIDKEELQTYKLLQRTTSDQLGKSAAEISDLAKIAEKQLKNIEESGVLQGEQLSEEWRRDLKQEIAANYKTRILEAILNYKDHPQQQTKEVNKLQTEIFVELQAKVME